MSRVDPRPTPGPPGPKQVGRIVVLVLSGVLVLLQVFHGALIRPMIDSAFSNAEELPEAFEQQRAPTDHPINTVLNVAIWVAGSVLLVFLRLGHKWARIVITVWLSLGIVFLGCLGTGAVLIAAAMGVKGGWKRCQEPFSGRNCPNWSPTARKMVPGTFSALFRPAAGCRTFWWAAKTWAILLRCGPKSR